MELREIWATTESTAFLDFPNVRQIFCIRRTTTDLNGNVVKGRKSIEDIIYGVASLPPERASAAQLLAYNRGHWEIENRVHHVRDMTYDEDRSQVRKSRRPHTMATLRNTAISLLRLAGVKCIAAATRCLAWGGESPLRFLGLA